MNYGEDKMPLVRVKQKFQVTIPDTIRKEVRLEVGNLLEATAHGNTIVLTPKAVVDRSVEDALSEGLRDLKEGRVFGPFRSVKEFKQALKKR